METAAWAHAAGMDNFQTYYSYCRYYLRTNFTWPPDIKEVDLGLNHKVQSDDLCGIVGDDSPPDCLYPSSGWS